MVPTCVLACFVYVNHVLQVKPRAQHPMAVAMTIDTSGGGSADDDMGTGGGNVLDAIGMNDA